MNQMHDTNEDEGRLLVSPAFWIGGILSVAAWAALAFAFTRTSLRITYQQGALIALALGLAFMVAAYVRQRQSLALSQADASRYRWLRERLMAADFDWNDSGESVLVFKWPKDVGVGGNCDQNVDAGMAAHPITEGGF